MPAPPPRLSSRFAVVCALALAGACAGERRATASPPTPLPLDAVFAQPGDPDAALATPTPLPHFVRNATPTPQPTPTFVPGALERGARTPAPTPARIPTPFPFDPDGPVVRHPPLLVPPPATPTPNPEDAEALSHPGLIRRADIVVDPVEVAEARRTPEPALVIEAGRIEELERGRTEVRIENPWKSLCVELEFRPEVLVDAAAAQASQPVSPAIRVRLRPGESDSVYLDAGSWFLQRRVWFPEEPWPATSKRWPAQEVLGQRRYLLALSATEEAVLLPELRRVATTWREDRELYDPLDDVGSTPTPVERRDFIRR